MAFTLDQHALYRDAECARLARWFGDSAIGPVFFARADRAIPVSAGERDLWLAQGERIVERHVAQQRRVGWEAAGIALVLMAAMSVATSLLGDVVPVLRSIPSPFAATAAMLWPVIQQIRYDRRIRALRREISDRVRMRSPLDSALVPRGKRYNLFAGASAVAAFGAVGWAGLSAMWHDGMPDVVPVLALLPIAWLFFFAARRIDRVQRDRRLARPDV